MRCKLAHHHDRGYALKHHKNEAIIVIFFNSFALLDEAEKIIVRTQGMNGVKALPHNAEGCFLSIELNPEPPQ